MVMGDFGASHRKVRKAQQHFRTRITRIAHIFTDTANPRASAQNLQNMKQFLP